MKYALMLSTLILSGCSLLGVGRIKSGDVTVQGVKDAGKPASLATSASGATVTLPAGSVVTVTKSEAVAATPTSPAQPAKEVTEIHPNGPSEYHKTEQTVKADTGTVDTSIALKKVDAAESRPLLYASILAALAAGFFVYRAYPTPAICCGGASVVFFLSWRMSDLPPWIAAVGLAAIAGGVALWLGHHRGLYEPVPTDKAP